MTVKLSFRPYWMILIGFMISCTDEIEVPSGNDDNEFYPIAIGDFREYSIEEINYEISGFDTLQYFLKETVVDSFRSGGFDNYILERRTRELITDEWAVDSVWSVRAEPGQVVLGRSNFLEVILVFPVAIGTEWNRNQLNTFPSDFSEFVEFAVEEIEVDPSVLSTEEFIKVNIEDIPANIVSQNQHAEIYGKGIGLLQKDLIDLSFCTVNCDSANQILSGKYFKQVLIAHEVN